MDRKKSVAAICAICLGMVLLTSCSRSESVASDGEGYNNSGDIQTSGTEEVRLSYGENKEIVRQEYTLAARNDRLELYYHPLDGAILVRDLQNETWYSSAADIQGSGIDPASLNDIWTYNLNTLINVSYYTSGMNKGVAVETTPAKEKAKMAVTQRDDGIDIAYHFDNLKLYIRLSLTLSEDCLSVSIPKDAISEYGDTRITSVKVLPFFASGNTGYAVIPDGSGALFDYGQNVEGSDSQYNFPVYGEPIPGESFLSAASIQQEDPVSLPAFGVKSGDGAFVAAITQGEADAVIEYSPNGYIVGTNRVSTVFHYRYQVDMSAISGTNTGFDETQKQASYRFESQLRAKDVQVKYFFLQGDQADYSGMANRYRQYLIEEGILQKQAFSSDSVTPYVDFFMGVYEQKIMLPPFQKMTTFLQCESILKQLGESGVQGVRATLWGCLQDGYGISPAEPKLESRYGSTEEFQKLVQTAGSLGGRISLQIDPFLLNVADGGFSTKSDSIYNLANIPITDTQNSLYFRQIRSQFETYLPDCVELAQKYGVGLDIQHTGDLLFLDSNRKSIQNRQDQADYVTEQLGAIGQQGVAVTIGSNLYALRAAETVSNAPISSTGYDIETCSIPFYQMVIHGFVPYTASPLNLESDVKGAELKWVEYGYMPYFLITGEEAQNLKNTEANWIYTSTAEKWIPIIEDVCTRMNEKIGGLVGQTMVNHRELAEEVYAVTYENGQEVVVNYSDTPYTYKTVTVESRDYACVE